VKTYSKQYRHLATIITGVGLTFFSITAEAETIGYEQSPSQGGFGSDGLVATVADEFQLDQSALIRNITWWGGYAHDIQQPPPVADDFTMRLFADQSGKPGAVLRDFNLGNDVNRVATGDFLVPPSDFFPDELGVAEFKYSFDLPGSFVAKANTRYWLSILNVPVADGWSWEMSDSLMNLGVDQQRRFRGDPVFRPWMLFDQGGNSDFNLAFQVGIDPVDVSEIPEPSSVMLLATVVGLTMFVGRRRRRTQGAAPCPAAW